MASMKVSAPGMFANLIADFRKGRRSKADYYEFCLDELLTHMRETAAGKHTLAEFAAHYCIEPTKGVPHA